MTPQPKDNQCRGVILGNIANDLTDSRETVVGRTDVLSAVNEDAQSPNGLRLEREGASPEKEISNSVVTIREDVECETLKRPDLVVKLPIEYLTGDKAVRFEVPIHPGSRSADVMAALERRVPRLHALELYCSPRNQAVCRDAQIWELAVNQNQHFMLRRRSSVFARIRQWLHDKGLFNLVRPCSCR